ncbi:unnamed protein product [Callosobruchus maculatus]|uniref:AMP-dependent synthetase/ligase domain-containing protein n=1 Tax=Callosobruchus maculatus TaxID=64391 RepID=A0A653C344_CALMS|nr:unnamed protein product [Callosobruchus maculatus]
MADNGSSTQHNSQYIVDSPPLDYTPDERGLGYQCFDCMKKYSDKIAQYLADTDEEETYESLLSRCIRVAMGLKSRGLTKEDVVIIYSTNQKNSCVPFIACLFLGIPVGTLDPMLFPSDTTHLLKEVAPKVLFVVPKSVDFINSCVKEAGINAEIIVFDETEDHESFMELLKPQEGESEFVPETVSSLDETAVISFSNTTTGLPKGIMISHYALLVECNSLADTQNFGSVSLTHATLYWISTVAILSAMVYTGGARVIRSKFDAGLTWSLLEKYQITSLFVSPSQMAELVKCGRPENLDTSRLRTCISGRGAISDTLMKEMRALLPGTLVFQMYGHSEVAGAMILFNTSREKDVLLIHKNPRSVGTLLPSICCKVVDPDTEELCGPNQSGELRVMSKLTMNGYYGMDSSDSYDADGWLKTGDKMYYDEDRCFYVVDRY